MVTAPNLSKLGNVFQFLKTPHLLTLLTKNPELSLVILPSSIQSPILEQDKSVMLSPVDGLNLVSKYLRPTHRQALHPFLLLFTLKTQLLVVIKPKGVHIALFISLLPIMGDHKGRVIPGVHILDVPEVDRGRFVEITPILLSFEGIPQSPVAHISEGVHPGP